MAYVCTVCMLFISLCIYRSCTFNSKSYFDSHTLLCYFHVCMCVYVCIYVARWLSAFFRCDYDEAIQEYPAWGVRIPPRLLERCVRGSQRPHLFTYPGYTALSHTYLRVYLQQLTRIPYIYSTYVCIYVLCMYVYYRVMKIFAKNE